MTAPVRPIIFGGVVFDNPYIGDPPTIPAGTTVAEYRHNRPRSRTLWQRFVRRLNGH